MMSAVGTRGSRGGHRDRASSAKTQTQPGGKGAQGPQPERLPKQPQATSEQMRIAQMISDTSTEDPQWQEKIQQVRDVTGRGLDEATVALHDCDGDSNRAINMLLEGEQDQGEWETAGKKKSRSAPSTQRGNDSGPPGKENREEYRRGRNRDDRDRDGSSSRGRGPPRMSRGGGRGGSRPRENGMADDKEGSRDRGGRGRGDRRNRGDRDGDRRPGRFGHMNGPSRPGRGGFGRPRHDGPKIGTFNPDEIKTEKTSDIWPNTESEWFVPGTWNPDQIETQEDWGADGDWTGDLSESKVFTPSAPVPNPEPIRSTPYQGERIDLAKLLNPNGGSSGAAETNGPQSYGPMGDNMGKLGTAPSQGLHQGSSSLGMTSLGTSLGTSIGSSMPAMTFAQQQNQAPDQQTRPAQLPPSLQQVIQPPSSAAPGGSQAPGQPPLSSVQPALSSVPQPLNSAQVGPRQAKPPRRKMPPPSKVGKSAIPESAVEMPGGSMYSVDSLDIQFGAMDFGSESSSAALDFGFGTDGTSGLLGTSSLGVSTSGGSRLTATNTDTTYGSGFAGSGVNDQSLQSIMSTGSTATTQTTQPAVETPSPRSAYQSPHHTPQKDTSKGIQVTGPEPIPFPSSQMEGKTGPLVGSQRSQPSGMDALGSNKSEPSLSSLPPPPGVATSASQLSSHQAVSSGLSGSSYAPHTTTSHSSGHHSYRETSGSHTSTIQGSAISAANKLGSGLKDSSAYDSQLSSNQPSLDHMSHSMAGSHTTGGSTSVQSSTVQSTGSAGLTSALGLATTGSVTSTTAPSLKGSLGTTGPHVVSRVSQPHNAAPFPGKAPPNLPPGVGLLHNQYLIGPGTAGMLPAYGFFNWPQNAARMAAQSQHQPIYSFEDMQVLQSRMPMAGYAYDMQFQPPTTLTGRDGTLPAYSAGTDSKFTRGEASSPIPSSVAGQQQQQQSTHHGQTQAFLNPAAGIPPGYNYSMPFYHGVAGIAPTGFNYGPAMFMAPATKQHGAGTATTQFQQPGGYGQPGTHGYGTGYDDLTQTQDFTKSGYPSGTQTGSKGTVGSTGKGSVSSGTSAGSDLNMYGKTHQSFDKQGFPAGTPPPFNLPLATGGQGGPLNPAAATGYPHTAFMTPMMPHHTQHHSQIPHHLLQQDGQGGTSQRSQPSGSQPKGPSSKSAYGSTYWGAN
ncbi:ubiquitin-associated protein 2-like isoform X7 [Branchiostoma lanceolatum]|uniref:ubiquitin-associated protein 2-like isoform X7 n=1 Tax=Branchiostoma lanceolatum TaxID=7740 RepID=UPI003455F3B2